MAGPPGRVASEPFSGSGRDGLQATENRSLGLAEVLASVGALVTELLLDTHELVVLGGTLGPAGSASLDLASAKANNEVGDGGVLSLARPVGDHDAPALGLRELAGSDGLGDSADLVHLEEEAAAGLLLDGSVDALGVGHEEVVTDNLRIAHASLELDIGIPVVLVKGVLDGDNGVVLGEALVHLDELRIIQQTSKEVIRRDSATTTVHDMKMSTIPKALENMF
jgi:hypothetical protein